MIKRFIALSFLQFVFFSLSAQSEQKTFATKQETIDWLIGKMKQYFSHSKDSEKRWWELTADGNIIKTTLISLTEDGTKNVSPHLEFDMEKFYDYNFIFEDERWSLSMFCSNCVTIHETNKTGNQIVISLQIDEQMKNRFIKALEHLKKLSSNNKEKF